MAAAGNGSLAGRDRLLNGRPLGFRCCNDSRYACALPTAGFSSGPLVITVRVTRSVGHFVPAGVPIMMISRRGALDRESAAELVGAFDIGPMRTMQQDVEFGVIQIVDIALRAISPAVNDPSTAISCIDQLTRILICW